MPDQSPESRSHGINLDFVLIIYITLLLFALSALQIVTGSSFVWESGHSRVSATNCFRLGNLWSLCIAFFLILYTALRLSAHDAGFRPSLLIIALICLAFSAAGFASPIEHLGLMLPPEWAHARIAVRILMDKTFIPGVLLHLTLFTLLLRACFRDHFSLVYSLRDILLVIFLCCVTLTVCRFCWTLY
ncbi:MAG: hypothetical protein SGJ20_07590 [Planctomycetota bacterium]|nr:hypothetical protein [Planctomycetota bacterium]